MTTGSRDGRVKVTHTLSRATRERLRDLVERGEVRDASAAIEEALTDYLRRRKLERLRLELEAFDDEAFAADVARATDEGIEDVAQQLRSRA